MLVCVSADRGPANSLSVENDRLWLIPTNAEGVSKMGDLTSLGIQGSSLPGVHNHAG